MKKFSLFILLSVLFLPATLVSAADPIETQAKEIEKLLIAPCCWNYVVDQHHSGEALEMKAKIRSMLEEGKTKAEILAYYESLHGEKILADPKAKGFNLLAWILPALALIFGATLATLWLKRWKRESSQEQKEVVEAPESEVEDEYTKRIDEELYGKKEAS